MKTLKETLTIFIIMALVTSAVLFFGLQGVETVDDKINRANLSDIEKEYCKSAFDSLPYDEFLRETQANNVNCNL